MSREIFHRECLYCNIPIKVSVHSTTANQLIGGLIPCTFFLQSVHLFIILTPYLHVFLHML